MNLNMAAGQDEGAEKLMVKYIGQKVSKVRWKPNHYGQLRTADKFLTGSWDDEKNNLCLWGINGSDEEEYFDNEAGDGEPDLLCSVEHYGSVTDMQFVTSDHFITSSSCGDLSLYETSKDEKELIFRRSWKHLHKYGKDDPCSCNGISVSQANVVSAGEDGRINVIQLERKDPFRVIENSECVSLTSVVHTHSSEVVTTNAIGQLKTWDLRQPGNKPTKTMILSGEKVALQCVDRHPFQPYLVITGSADGGVSVWDLRNESYPVAMIDAHESEVWEVKFHQQYPDNLFTCSEDGSSWYWDGTSIATTTTQIRTDERALPLPNMDNSQTRLEMQQSVSPWLLVGTNKDMLETYSLLPINDLPVNSIDIDSRSLVCGTDGEAIIIVQDIPLK